MTFLLVPVFFVWKNDWRIKFRKQFEIKDFDGFYFLETKNGGENNRQNLKLFDKNCEEEMIDFMEICLKWR